MNTPSCRIPSTRQPVAEPDLAEQIDRRLFEDAGTNALDDVRFAADFHGHRVDAGLVEQVAEEQARGTGADDGNGDACVGHQRVARHFDTAADAFSRAKD